MHDTKYNVMLTIAHAEVSSAALVAREVSTRRTTTSINVLTTYATNNSDGYGYYNFKWLVIGRYKN